MDWTWEGASAYQLRDPDDPTDRVWSGEVVQLDEDRGHIYVSLQAGEVADGPFRVRPFGFLDALQALFVQCETLQDRASGVEAALVASLGQPPSRGWSMLWGPPGTGKTWTIGRRVAEAEPGERLLVASTTNRATDAVALQIAAALKERGRSLDGVRRVGAGADLARFEARGAEALVARAAAAGRRRLAQLVAVRRRADDPEERARLTQAINTTRRAIRDAAGAFLDPDLRVVVCTAFHALNRTVAPEVTALAAAGRAPFTTVVLDEAGLSSRAATAGMAQLAARHNWLVGDPQQLAPISRVARVLPSAEARWLAQSALSHLDPRGQVPANVELLTVQHRMGPDIRRVVSDYAYDGRLSDAETVLDRTFAADGRLLAEPRALWYVLDEDTGGRLADIRAERGPGHRSWVRRRTPAILDELLRAHPSLAQHRTLLMTPFRAQAQALMRWAGERGLLNWEACTVHAQQGAEAPVVLFDPVNAGSHGWGAEEWRRLVNVAASRAQHQLIVLASRLEMQEPYLRPLADLLAPRVLERAGSSWTWRAVPGLGNAAVRAPEAPPTTLG
ncbi:MAG: AAA domain-containing protein, partial [Myxococcota bacterium]